MDDKPKVIKFGGTSLQDAKAIGHAVEVAQSMGPYVVVVVSAMGGITDLLLASATKATQGDVSQEATATFRTRHLAAIERLSLNEDRDQRLRVLVEEATTEFSEIISSLSTLGEHTPRVLDRTASRGERLMAELFCATLNSRGSAAEVVDPLQIIHVARQFGTLAPDLERARQGCQKHVQPCLQKGSIAVIPGFIGKGPDGALATLGRGGTDLTATIIGQGVDAASVTLFKEVDGILTADPRFVAEARVVPALHYREAAELAYYGAKVLHSRTIIPLVSQKIPLIVKNTAKPDEPGTMIGGDVAPGAFPVKALTAITQQALLSIEGKGMMGIPGIAGRTFSALAQAGISVSLISQASSEASICFVVDGQDAVRAQQTLRETFHFEIHHQMIDEIKLLPDQAVIAAIGLGMKGTPGIASRCFTSLASAEVNVEAIAQGSSELNISAVIPERDVAPALQTMHREFRLSKLRQGVSLRAERTIDYAIHGFGQIGRTLVEQISNQSQYFQEKMGLNFRCVGIADSTGAIANHDGLSLEVLQHIALRKANGEKLAQINPAASEFVFEEAVGGELHNGTGIFIDVTAEESFAKLQEALSKGWHVAIANKKPLAVAKSDYDALFELAQQQNAEFRYEATVGAGLPILDTIAKLEGAGDRVLSILGCLSGTLGFLMTELEDGSSFSQAVRKAYLQGYTEPDPREDLNGMDVARKALILGRRLGLAMEIDQMKVDSLFTDAVSNDHPETFIQNLQSLDAEWAERITQAKQKDLVVRYVARIENGIVEVGVDTLPLDSSLGRLRGTDNQVTIKTERYDANPLIVTGPGAGAAVTAAGVLNDMIAIATRTEAHK